MERGVGGQLHKTPHFKSRHRYAPPRNDPPKNCLGPAQPPPHRCRTFPLLPVQMGYGLIVWRRNRRRPVSVAQNRRPCPPLSDPWTAWPDGSGR